jgi:hypothetical protein
LDIEPDIVYAKPKVPSTVFFIKLTVPKKAPFINPDTPSFLLFKGIFLKSLRPLPKVFKNLVGFPSKAVEPMRLSKFFLRAP